MSGFAIHLTAGIIGEADEPHEMNGGLRLPATVTEISNPIFYT